MKAADWQGSVQRVLQTARTLKIRQDAQRGEFMLVADTNKEEQRRRLTRIKETETPEEARVRRAGEEGKGEQPGSEEREAQEEGQDPDKGKHLDRRA